MRMLQIHLLFSQYLFIMSAGFWNYTGWIAKFPFSFLCIYWKNISVFSSLFVWVFLFFFLQLSVTKIFSYWVLWVFVCSA